MTGLGLLPEGIQPESPAADSRTNLYISSVLFLAALLLLAISKPLMDDRDSGNSHDTDAALLWVAFMAAMLAALATFFLAQTWQLPKEKYELVGAQPRSQEKQLANNNLVINLRSLLPALLPFAIFDAIAFASIEADGADEMMDPWISVQYAMVAAVGVMLMCIGLSWAENHCPSCPGGSVVS